MDGGRMEMPDAEYALIFEHHAYNTNLSNRYEEYYIHFKGIFRVRKEIPYYFIPGNHDTG